MRLKNYKRLVIDTDVAQASGDENATDPRAINCRDCLMEVMANNHKIVMTKNISDEWKTHQSRYAFEWRTSMDARRRVERINPPKDEVLQGNIKNTSDTEDEFEVMQKDIHLLEAALETDLTVISLDQTVRTLFAKASQQVSAIRKIIWVNPNRITEEQPIVWLKSGAPPEVHRQLSAYQVV